VVTLTDLLDRLEVALTDRYVIERELGEGGMAMVYLATDVRHARPVALKVLKPEIVASMGQERFLREITVTAQLNHPRILPLLDSGQADGLLFYVMPFVEGESLRDRLAREGPLPLEEAVEIAREMAVALSYAHAHGVVHRDIKPENVMLSQGEAVVADFGIARAITEAGGTRLTGTGLAVGTPAYMSPEQAAGERQVDARSDLYAVGCVLYEMLAGEPPYTGPTAAAITARKLTEPVPSLRTVRESVPATLEAVVGKALARAPADRYTTAQQLIDALNLARTPVLGTQITPVPTSPGGEQRWKILAAAAVVVALVAAWASWRSSTSGGTSSQIYRLSIPIAPLAVSDHGPASQVALSPDGTRLAYVSGQGGSGQLYLRSLGGSDPVAVSGAANAQGPFFSPDGEWLGFASGDTLKKVRLADGSVVPLCHAGWLHGATWGPDGTIVFSGTVDGGQVGLLRVAADGGTPEVVLRPDSSRTEPFLLYPSFLPSGKDVLVTGGGPGGDARNVSLVTIATGERRVLFEGGGNAQYLPTGHLVYGQDGALFTVGFDPDKGEIQGTPVRGVPDVLMGLPLEVALAHFTVSRNGTLVYLPSRGGPTVLTSELVWADRAGAVDTIPGLREAIAQSDIGWTWGPRVSPDGKRLLFWSYHRGSIGGYGAASNVWVFDLARRTLAKLSVDQPTWFFSIWSPDGRRVVATVGDSATSMTRLYAKRADGVGPAELLTHTDGPYFQQPYSFSADGRKLLFHQSMRGQNSDIYVLDMDAGGTARPFIDGPAFESHPALSPDGRWLAYVSDERGRFEVYLTDFPAHGGRWQVSTDGGTAPVWAPDGHTLYFQKLQWANFSDLVLMSAKIDDVGGAPSIGTPAEALLGPFAESNEFGRSYDIAPDGTRFLMARRSGLNAPLDLLTVVLNWTRELPSR
jgi:serine/threonine protein kinase